MLISTSGYSIMYFRLKYTRIPNLKDLSYALAHLGLEFGFSIIFSAWIQLKFVTFQTRLKKSNLRLSSTNPNS